MSLPGNSPDGSVIFKVADLNAFFEASGDANPLHLDTGYARKTAYGCRVVYGALGVLSCLRILEPIPICRLEASFRKPIFLNWSYNIHVREQNQERAHLELCDGQMVLLEVTVFFDEDLESLPRIESTTAAKSKKDTRRLVALDRPATDFATPITCTGSYQTRSERKQWPSICEAILGLASYMVGMEMPGRAALFSKISVNFLRAGASPAYLDYHLKSQHFDEAFRLLSMALNVTAQGQDIARAELSAFVREVLPPLDFSPFVHLEQLGLKSKVALVVGGSRGLGAALTSALVHAGCDVWLNYVRSKKEVNSLRARLRTAPGNLFLLPGNATNTALWEAAETQILEQSGKLDLLICNACAPPLSLPQGKAGKTRVQSYIRKNLALALTPVQILGSLLAASTGTVVAISSIYAATGSQDFPHYGELKQNLEQEIERIAQEQRQVAYLVVRPPLLRTQMSSGPSGNAQALAPELAATAIVRALASSIPTGQVALLEDFQSKALLAPAVTEPTVSGPSLVLCGSFTTEPMLQALTFWRNYFKWPLPIKVAPYRQEFQQLLGGAPDLVTNLTGLNVIAIRLEDWLRDVEASHQLETARHHLKHVLTDFITALESYASSSACQTLLLLCPSSPAYEEDPNWSIQFQELTETLAEGVAPLPHIHLERAADRHLAYGVTTNPYHEVRDELGHIPFIPEYYHVLGTLVARAYHGTWAKRYKLIVTDCDNTLWGGVCAELGAKSVGIDRSNKSLQRCLLAHQQKGMLLALNSKNSPLDVHEVFDKNPDMILQRSHFVDERINWLAKSSNLTSIAESLDISLESIIFIDDSPLEIEEVRQNQPQVMSIQWPSEASQAERMLAHHWLLDQAHTATAEDRDRTAQYRANNQRAKHASTKSNFQSFYNDLQLKVELTTPNSQALPRLAQLSERTNQFNLTTIRRSSAQLRNLLDSHKHQLIAATVSDRFGNYGLVGLIILKQEQQQLQVDSFMLSCRALGRGVEHRMLAHVGELALEQGLESVRIPLAITERNQPARNFLESVGPLKQLDHDHFELVQPAEPLKSLRFQVPETAPAPAPAIVKQGHEKEAVAAEELANQYLHIAQALSSMAQLTKAIETEPSEEKLLQDEDSTLPEHRENLRAWVYALFAQQLSISAQALDAKADLSSIVKDSFKRVELTVALKKQYPNLPTTFLYEHRSLEAIIQHLSEEYQGSSQSESEPIREHIQTDIAVIGMSGRFPGAANVSEFWKLLSEGRDSMTEVPADRWDVDRYYSETLKPGKTYCRKGGFIQDVDRFDAAFFHISPKEAELMDPQQRLLLEVVWNLLEDAALTPERLSRKTGVFVGVNAGDYGMMANVAALGGASAYRHADFYQLANRISYHFDLNGPSLTLDTACSSSGTALHLACENLRHNRCQAAIVGGLNMFLHPSRFVQYAHMRMISPSGTCSPFGENADGTLFGEGVGSILLKPLTAAQKDRDPIHGIIKSCAINSGGKTNGFTVPNPRVQADLVVAALTEAEIDPITISYVEAHGTGTLLGDPIEIRGLSLAFSEEMTRRGRGWQPGFCGIGSLKANIGHLEAGAAIPSIIKVLLQMKHRQLVPTLNAARTNPKIEFSTSPFRVQQNLQDWPETVVEVNGRSQAVPRRAGVSSFGAGGANAHVILEEYSRPEANASLETEPRLFVLSAQDEEALDRRASSLHQHLSGEGSNLEPADLAFTLAVGRQAMDQRLAFVARNLDEVREVLGRVTLKPTADPVLVWGQVGHGKTIIEELLEGPEGATYLEMIYQGRNLKKLARMWVAGLDIDWDRLFPAAQPNRINLPGYIFKGERFWLPDELAQTAEGAVGKLHTLLDGVHASHSLENGISYHKRYSRNDRLLADHEVAGEPTLPGVAYLAMVVAAARQLPAEGVLQPAQVIWPTPFTVPDEARELLLHINREQAGLTFKITSQGVQGPVLHCRGNLRTQAESQPQTIAVAEIAGRCGKTVEREAIYSRFRAMGIHYGTYFRSLQQVLVGENEALGTLKLPDAYSRELGNITPHPSLADGALQTALYLTEPSAKPAMPFAVNEVEVLQPLTASAYAYAVRDREGAIQVAILDEAGRICLKYHQLTFRAGPDNHEQFYFVPRWQVASQPETSPASQPKTVLILGTPQTAKLAQALADQHPEAEVHQLVLAEKSEPKQEHRTVSSDEGEALTHELERIGPLDRLYYLSGIVQSAPELADHQAYQSMVRQAVMPLFRIGKALPALGKPQLDLVTCDTWAHGRNQTHQPIGAAIHGLGATMAQEHPRLTVVSVDLASSELKADPGGMAQKLASESGSRGQPILWREGIRHRRILEPTSLAPNQKTVFRKGGVYLILGGAGGIGYALSRHLAKNHQARLVWLGRRPRTTEIEQKQAAIHQLGGQVHYQQADATKPDSMRAAIQQVSSQWGAIHGAIHSAIVLADKTLAKMSEASFRAAFDPKVSGSVALYQALKHEPLDFLLFFSSVNSFTTPAGQSNYSSGCCFKDAYAAALTAQGVPAQVVNWGYWGTVGIVATEAYRKRITAQGYRSISPELGMEATERFLAGNRHHVVAVKGKAALLQMMGVSTTSRAHQHPEGIALQEVTLANVEMPQPDLEHAAGLDQGLVSLENLGAEFALGVFQRLGVFQDTTETYQVEPLRNKLHICEGYTALYHALLEMLNRHGLLKNEQGSITLSERALQEPQQAHLRDPQQACEQLVAKHPQVAERLPLLLTCIRALPDVITGKRNNVGVLFPEGSLHLVENIYKSNPTTDYYSRTVAALVETATKQHQQASDRVFRVLEVGAGTGGTTTWVLAALSALNIPVEYVYSDISSRFTRHGQETYGQRYPFVRFRLLDMEKDPEQQGFEPGTFHVILGTNCLHAMRRVDRTLWHLKRLLTHGGLLVVNEFVTRLDYNTLTFGLTSGWWHFLDGEQRIPHSPLLSIEKWRALLASLGFNAFKALNYPENRAATLGQVVMLAQSDGSVSLHNQPRTESHDPTPKQEQPGKPLQKEPSAPVLARIQPTPAPDLSQQTQELVRTTFAEVLRIQKDRIRANATFDTFGVDSLISLEIVEKLEKIFGNLSDVLLFEYDTLAKLSEYLIKHHQETLRTRLGSVTAVIQETRSLFKPGGITAETQPQDAPECQAGEPQHALPANEPRRNQDIAVIGMACRYPRTPDIHTLWKNLAEGRDCITEVPSERWVAEEHARNRWGGFIEDADRFDAPFFNIPPTEAPNLDPSERLFLETTWRALEDSGNSPSSLDQHQAEKGPIGVFAGCMYQHYPHLGTDPDQTARLANNSYWSIANRVSYYFDFKGPSMALDTACSSSLTALHLAIQNIHDGTCSMAITGGVNLSLHPGKYDNLQRLGMLGSTPKSKSLGAGDGLIPAEGVGVVVLKPHVQAQADGDPIWGLVKGSAVNHGGRTSGFTVPSPTAHGEVAEQALARSGLDVETITYVDVAANGSALGDPLEVAGLAQAFRRYTQKKHYCAMGSVKSNLGHTEAASGIAQLMKVLLQMRYHQLVPTLHAQPQNPSLNLAETPFVIQTTSAPWQPAQPGQPLRASINGFGAGGSNAHVVLEEALRPEETENEQPVADHIFVLSARNEERLKAYAASIVTFLESENAVDIAYGSLIYTYQAGRQAMTSRLAIVANNPRALKDRLKGYLRGHSHLEHVYQGQTTVHTETYDHEDTAYLQSLIGAGKLDRLARLWVTGMNPDWRVGQTKLRRLAGLPTYPFAGASFWVDKKPAAPNTSNRPKPDMPTTATEPAVPVEQASEYRDEADCRANLFATAVTFISQILGLDESDIDVAMDMNELGLDSINIAELAERLNEALGTTATASLFFGYASLGDCLTELWEENRDKLCTALPADATSSSPQSPAQQEPTKASQTQASPETREPQPVAQRKHSRPTPYPLAVVGMSARLPQSADLAAFWQHLVAGNELIREIPADRWDWREYAGDPHEGHNKTRSRWGAFLDDIDQFDPIFFGISPSEAELMDPQQRLLLEVSWQTIENAGYAPADLAGSRTGVFVAACNHDYQKLLRQHNVALQPHSATGNMVSPILANRLSYYFDFRGPSEIVDTACSSSVVALHRAVRAIRGGECEMALVAGVNILLTPDSFIMLDKAGILSSDGRVRLYEKDATGYVRGEGVTSVLLKPLPRAIADRDLIHGLIRATATNHDGKSYSMTAPNPKAQTEVILQAFEGTDIDPASITYIEAQGTGSPIGDPVEARAIRKAYQHLHQRYGERAEGAPSCGIGYLKPCVGHLESAYGITAMVKVLLAMAAGLLPGTPLVNREEARAQFQGSPLYVVTENRPWPEPKDEQGKRLPRRGAVHAYGFGGVNAHLLLEEFIEPYWEN